MHDDEHGASDSSDALKQVVNPVGSQQKPGDPASQDGKTKVSHSQFNHGAEISLQPGLQPNMEASSPVQPAEKHSDTAEHPEAASLEQQTDTATGPKTAFEFAREFYQAKQPPGKQFKERFKDLEADFTQQDSDALLELAKGTD